MKIDQLPIEMLMKIFSYLSRFDEISLVNKLFYSVACTINDPNICLRLDDRLFQWLPSVEKSTRQISKLNIYFCLPDVATFRAMISIISKFGASIRCLRIFQTHMTMSNFLEILSLVPNVEHLDLEGLRLQGQEALQRRKRSGDNDLDLYQLKKLRFGGNCMVERDAILAVFDRLPVGVLTELELNSFTLNAVVVLFKRQTNIVKLEVTDIYFNALDPVDIFDNLQLESLVISSHAHDIEKFLSNQTQLKSLTVPNTDVTEVFLNFVAKHTTELETLSIEISTAPSASCKANINKIKSLKDLTVSVDDGTPMNQLAEYPYLGITSLSLCHYLLNVNLVQALAKSLTKLKSLEVYCFDDYGSPTIISAIMVNFNFVEVLHISGNIDGFYHQSYVDYFNPQLKELIAPLPKFGPRTCLSKLIADYPNLKKFQIDKLSITSAQFRKIVNGFTKLESLSLIGERLTVDDLNYLNDHKNNLKFVSLEGFRHPFTNELKRHLSTSFGVIICNDYDVRGERVMAVDRHTMNRERKMAF